MTAVWTRREVIVLLAMIAGLAVLGRFKQMLRLIDLSRRKARPEFAPEWIEVLKLGFHEGLNDRAIAQRMGLHERTVRAYWTRIQDALNIPYHSDKNVIILTMIEARKAGLID